MVSVAKTNLATATTALIAVKKAKTDVAAAQAEATHAAANASLSTSAKTAATAIAQALQQAELRLDKVNTKDFQKVIDDLEDAAAKAAVKDVTGISVSYQGHEILTANTASWDSKAKKLTIKTGLAWKVPTDYMTALGKDVKVSGTYTGDGGHFTNNMKVDSAGAKAASFKS
jgi:hypothetical protein